MALFRKLAGFAAVIALMAALNFLVVREDLFLPVVLIPLIAGLLCAIVWLVLTIIALAGTTEARQGFQNLNVVFASIVFLAICVVLYAFVRHSGRSWDLTQEGRRELSEQTIRVLESLREDIEVLCLFPRSGDREIDTAREKTLRFLEQCQRHTLRLKIETADPYEEGDRLQAIGITAASPQGTIVLRCGTRPPKGILLHGPNPRMEERDFTNALINVARNAQPKVYFLAGHSQKALRAGDAKKGIFTLKDFLDREGYVSEEVILAGPDAIVPADCDLFVINDLEADLTATELEALTQYAANGGSLLVLLNPWRVLRGAENFRPWLEQRFGVLVGTDYVICPLGERFGEVKLVPNTLATSYFEQYGAPEGDTFQGCYNANHAITRGFDQSMILSTVRSVTLKDTLPDGVAGEEVLFTLPYAWAETDMSFLDPAAQERQKPRRNEGEMGGPVSLAVAVTVNSGIPVGDSGQTKSARVVVVGDPDFAGEHYLTYPGNLNFAMNTFAWLTEHQELIAIRPTGKQDAPLMLTDAQERAVVWIPTLGVVQLLILVSVLVFVVRRRYQ